jgi:hypothetical protein
MVLLNSIEIWEPLEKSIAEVVSQEVKPSKFKNSFDACM